MPNHSRSVVDFLRASPVLLVLLAIFAGRVSADDFDYGRFIAKVRPSAAEERWRLIELKSSLVVAFRQAKAENKPVYYFAADGVLGSGNC